MLSSFFSSLSQIIVSEIGDKTFFITAILGMTYSIGIVFIGSYFASIVMTLLSCFMGFILPQIQSPMLSNVLASAMFIYFGQKQMWEIWSKDDDSDNEEDEARDEIKKIETQKSSVKCLSISRSFLAQHVWRMGRQKLIYYLSPCH